MIEKIKLLQQESTLEISKATSIQTLESLRVSYLGKKGSITQLLHQLKDLSSEERKEAGAVLNTLKNEIEQKIDSKKQEFSSKKISQEIEETQPIDVTLPGFYPSTQGSLHPITKVMEEIVSTLKKIGFSIATGPEAELEYYNFEALNTPENHPARDLQDTFYIQRPVLLRSHTSPVQIRAMKAQKPPIQIISIGKVYRSDFDVTHTPMFHQVEGLLVDKHISFSDLKGTLHYLINEIFGQRELRFRPSYFPFTEPSAEVDMKCIQCKIPGDHCRLCGSTGWLEVGGCGMVHPNVLNAVEYDIDTYRGFAFGLGIDRVAMLKYGMTDLRSLFENDLRMLEQF